ncbi:MAG: aspartyl protease family protein [Gemmatimonadaceae bacterium]|nr:aspartyl protease family protein [Gemmatimonadaceae bacterium]
MRSFRDPMHGPVVRDTWEETRDERGPYVTTKPASASLRSFMYRSPLALATFLACLALPLGAQAPRDTLRTDSRAMRVRDGYSTTDWWVEPNAQPDTYYLNFPLSGGVVTFVSERDSIRVTVKPGESRDFIVRLRDSVNVLTRVSATETYARPRIVVGDTLAVQIIPFTMRDDRVYVEGTINGSAPLVMQFDLGASGLTFNERSVKKAPVRWDATDVLVNSDGRHTAPSSRSATIRIGALEWTRQSIVQTGNMERYEDVIFGNSLFRDRVVEIDYDRRELRVHATTPPITSAFVRHPLALDNGVRPLIQAELLVNGSWIKDWYLFDTGHTGTLMLSAKHNRDQQLAARLGARWGIGDRRLFRARGFRIGSVQLPAGTAVVQVMKDVDRGNAYSLIGNSWLKRFNVILDNRRGAIWLAPTRAVASSPASASRERT